MRLRLWGAVLGAATLAGGCSGAPDQGSSPVTPDSSLDIPAVGTPLDAGPYLDDACALLDQRQRAELGLTAADEVPSGLGACELRESDDAYLSVRVEILPGGLTFRRDRCARPELSGSPCDTWTADSIDGYPVIRANMKVSKTLLCRLFLGIADDTTVSIFDNRIGRAGSGGPNCATADRAAAMVLATLAS